MKSVTIKNSQGVVLIKVLHRKSGEIESITRDSLSDLVIEVRDDTMHKIVWTTKED